MLETQGFNLNKEAINAVWGWGARMTVRNLELLISCLLRYLHLIHHKADDKSGGTEMLPTRVERLTSQSVSGGVMRARADDYM